MRDKVKIWEAARATSAATGFFEPISIAGQTFTDGATRANNPVNEVWTEATDLWGNGDSSWRLEDNLQFLVSIGTGMPSLTAFDDSILQIGKTLIAIATDCQTVAETFHRHHKDLAAGKRYFRFNVTRGLENVGLQSQERIGEIKAATRNYLSSEQTFEAIKECAANLRVRTQCRQSLPHA